MDRTTRDLGKKKRPKSGNTKTQLISKAKIDMIKEQTQQLAEQNVSFSFYYFKKDDDKYNMGNVSTAWFIKLKEVLRDVSQYPMKDFLPSFNHAKRWRCHGLEEDIVSQFGLDETLLDQVREGCFQFSITTSKGRVLGFNINSVFFVVLLDFHHNADPGIFGVQSQYPPKTLEDELLAENKILQRENKKLELRFSELESEYLQLLYKYEEREEEFKRIGYLEEDPTG